MSRLDYHGRRRAKRIGNRSCLRRTCSTATPGTDPDFDIRLREALAPLGCLRPLTALLEYRIRELTGSAASLLLACHAEVLVRLGARDLCCLPLNILELAFGEDFLSLVQGVLP